MSSSVLLLIAALGAVASLQGRSKALASSPILKATTAATEIPRLAAAALAQIRTLVGDWEGTFEWTGSRSGAGNMSATYYQTGNGSAVVEDLAIGGVRSMTSVYHLDGADLRMTHYCAAQNQPRLKAQRIDMTQGAVDFALVDVTNLRSPDAPHVDGLEMRFLDNDHILLTFLFRSGDQHSREQIKLTRVQAKPADKR